MPDICFHIGLYKTASSYLQKAVFPEVGGLGIGSSYNQNAVLERMKSCFLECSPGIWTEERGQKLADDIENFMPKDSNILYSDEALYRAKIFLADTHESLFVAEPYILAEHFRQFSKHAWGGRGRVRVFFYVRSQADWLASLYAQLSNRIKAASQEDFVQRVQNLVDHPSAFGGNVARFDVLTAALQDALGQENVLPLLYENLHDKETWQKLRIFTSLPSLGEIEPKQSGDGFKVRRKVAGHWGIRPYRERLKSRSPMDYMHKTLGRISGRNKYIHVTDDLRRDVQLAYLDSNREFERLSGCDLSGDKLTYYAARSSGPQPRIS